MASIRVNWYRDPSKDIVSNSTLYTDTPSPVVGTILYNNLGEDSGVKVSTVNSNGSFEVESPVEMVRDPEKDLTYDNNTGSYVLTSSLVKDYTLTIVPTPSDAKVTLTAEGYTQAGNSITVPEGFTVIYSVTRPGYSQKRDSVVVNSDITLNITLDQAEVDIIDESTTVKELEVNSTVYDIVGKGILDQNTKTTQLEWFGTLDEYKDLGEYSDHCTYYITDDLGISNEYDLGHLTEIINDFDVGAFKPEVDAIKNEAISDINEATSNSVEQLKNMGEVVNYTNITNCITEIPQDIKLELSGGALVLKAGSKLYVPNGFESDGVTLKFNVKNINSDIIRETVVNGQKMSLALYKNSDGSFLQIYELPYTSLCSGPTDSLSGVAYHAWYDTNNNIIKYYGTDGTTNNYHAAFPLCFVTGAESGGVASIDQVFNGFGYIGSTVFALPGVKGLIPNGRNVDGTLKNIEFTTDHVSIVTNQSSLSIDLWYSIDQNGNIANSLVDYWKYDYEKNGWFHGTDRWLDIPFACSHATEGKISDFSSKLVFCSVDYSDREFIAHQAMPSRKYIDITLGASGSSYTAPSDGTALILKTGNSGQYLTIDSYRNKSYFNYSMSSQTGLVSLQVSKGDSFVVWYNASGATDRFIFIYANGSK